MKEWKNSQSYFFLNCLTCFNLTKKTSRNLLKNFNAHVRINVMQFGSKSLARNLEAIESFFCCESSTRIFMGGQIWLSFFLTCCFCKWVIYANMSNALFWYNGNTHKNVFDAKIYEFHDFLKWSHVWKIWGINNKKEE